MANPNITDSYPVANEVQVNLHMLCPLMLNRVGGEVHDADVVAVDERDASATPLSTAWYSASALERETTSCRLDDQVAAEEDGIA
jgi:hypothetical protein